LKKDDLVGLLLILGTLLYFGAHIAYALARLLLPTMVSILPR
jgi:hypothetical protein